MQRGIWTVLVLLSVVGLAGCLSGDDDGTTTNTDTNTGDGTTPLYRLDCSIGGNGWDEPCLAHASPNAASTSHAEVNLVVNPLDAMNVVVASKDIDPAASNDCVWSVAQVSHDGGQTWTTSYVGGTIAERQPGDLLFGFDCVTDPIMTFNRDGDLFYNIQAYRIDGEPDNLGLPGPDAALMAMAVSHDGGGTWTEYIVEEVGDDVAIFPDYMHMGTNPTTGTVFAVWNTIGALVTSNPTIARYTGAEPVIVPTFTPSPLSPTGYGASSIVGGNDGTMYFCICSFNSGDTVWFTTSTDDGLTWEVPSAKWTFAPMGNAANVAFRHDTTVEMAIDNSGGDRDGCLYATWVGRDLDVAPGDAGDVFSRTSCDGGDTWTLPVKVNPDTATGAQFMANLAVDGRGTVHVLYLTQHYDEAYNHTWLDAEWAHSTDGGANWTAQRLTSIPFDGDLGLHQDGFPFLGDYIGIGAVGDHLYMGFPTTITGEAEIAVAHVVAS